MNDLNHLITIYNVLGCKVEFLRPILLFVNERNCNLTSYMCRQCCSGNRVVEIGTYCAVLGGNATLTKLASYTHDCRGLAGMNVMLRSYLLTYSMYL